MVILEDQTAAALRRMDRRALRDLGTRFGYDAADTTRKRRKPPPSIQQSEDAALSDGDRKKLLGTARDLRRNFPATGWAIRKHLDYVSTFTFQCRTPHDELNRKVEELVGWWSRPGNFDAAGRHGLRRFTRLLEERRVVDGDVFVVKLRDGRVQAIEGDRVRKPQRGAPVNVDWKEYTHGVRTTSAGRMKTVCICKRKANGLGYEFDRLVPARHIEQHAFFDRFDQVRGISPLAPAVNFFRDQYEGIDYALAKAKVAQLFGLIFYRDAIESPGDLGGGSRDDDGDGEPDDDAEDKSSYEIDFGKGPFVADLNAGDRAEFLENRTPSGEFAAFMQTVCGLALKSLDIPYSFYDEAYTTYSGARQAWLMYEQSADSKRRDLQDVLDALTRWRMGLFVEDGWIDLEAYGLTIPQLTWEWVPAGIPWIDPLKEVKADVEAVNNGLASRTDLLRARGKDFEQVVEDLRRENEMLAGLLRGKPLVDMVTPAGATNE